MSFLWNVNPCITLLSVGIVIVTITYRYMKKIYTTLERLGIPGPKPVWVFGNVLEFKGKNVLRVFDEFKKKYGNIYGFYEGFRICVVVNDVDCAQDILNRYFDKFSIRTSYRPFIYYPDNLRLIEIDGGHWKNQRVVMNKMLNSPNNMQLVIDKMQRTAKTMIRQINDELEHDHDGINISSIINQYVCEGVLRILLNMDDDNLVKYKDSVYNYQVQCILSASPENKVGGLARLFPCLTPILKMTDTKNKEAHDAVVNLLRKFINDSSVNQNNNDRHEDHGCLLSFLQSMTVPCRDTDFHMRQLTTDEMLAHMLSLLDETYATTSGIILFMLYELACHQDCQNRLFEEIRNLPEKDDDLSLDDLKNMEFFDMLFNETYRHHPIAPGLSRVCTENCTIRGVPFQKGMVVRVMTSPMYMDAKLFPEPEKFSPERFSERNRLNSHQYSFLPFGQGPRMCPGQKMAIIKVKVAVITILRKFIITPCKNTEIPLKHALRPSLMPANDVYIRLLQRCD